MSQVYTLVGDGRVAKHFAYYLQSLNIEFNQWSRQSKHNLTETVQDSQRILLLISDAAIAEFWQTHPCLHQKMVIHFSGAVTVDNIFSAHPLASFAQDYFDIDFYQGIPFAIAPDEKTFSELLPGLPNPYFFIPTQDKPFYHALCVLSGNFSVILWQKFFAEFANQWQIPSTMLSPYMESIMQNVKQNYQTALTGPLVRNDNATLETHLNVLSDDPFKEVYATFVELYQTHFLNRNN